MELKDRVIVVTGAARGIGRALATRFANEGGPEASDADWQRIWSINVMAHVYVARHALPGMLARQEGYLVGTVSAAGLLNHFLAAPYGVTKAAALSFFEWLSIV